MTIKKTLPLVFFLISIQVFSQSFDEIKKSKISGILANYIEPAAPGMAVGIVYKGDIVYKHYSGYANLEHEIEINKDTRFNIASNAKQFTALCILKLIEEDKLKLTDDIRKYLPELYKENEQKITIANLLNHTSGIRDVYDLWALKGQTWWQLFINNDDAIDLLKSQRDLNFMPGTEYMYSNSNYILLTEIVKKVTATNFDEYAQQVFKSLEMPNTLFLSNYMDIIPHKARPYGNWNGWKEYPLVGEIHGDGALFTTLDDQLKWEIIIQKNNGSLVSEDIIKQSHKPIQNSNTEGYGYGLMFDTLKGKKYTYHDGSTGAYNASFLRFPEDKLGIVVMSNNSNIPTNRIAKQISDEVLNFKVTTVVFPSAPEKIEKALPRSQILGSYRSEAGNIINIVDKNDTLYRKIYQRDPIQLFNEKGSLYYYANNRDLKMAFKKDTSGKIGFTIYFSSQAPIVYNKLPNYDLDEKYSESLDGVFFNDETQTTIDIRYEDGNKYIITANGRKLSSELVYKDFLRMNSYEINMSRDKNGNINGLLVKSGRIKNVRFKKM